VFVNVYLAAINGACCLVGALEVMALVRDKHLPRTPTIEYLLLKDLHPSCEKPMPNRLRRLTAQLTYLYIN